MSSRILSGIAAATVALLVGAAPVLAQTADAPRPHHGNYGDAAQARPAGTAVPPPIRAATNGGVRRAHHPDWN